MKTVNLVQFNRQDILMVQQGLSFCIPAIAHMIFRYHNPNFTLSQEYIMGLMVVGSSDHEPSFSAMVKYVKPVVSSTFDIDNPDFKLFSDWIDNIRKEIDSDNPIGISTRSSKDNSHIRVVLGYDDKLKKLLVFNSGSAKLFINPNSSSQVQGYGYQISSELEEYKYTDAQSDFNVTGTPGPNRDQLVIHKI